VADSERGASLKDRQNWAVAFLVPPYRCHFLLGLKVGQAPAATGRTLASEHKVTLFTRGLIALATRLPQTVIGPTNTRALGLTPATPVTTTHLISVIELTPTARAGG
jgi:hypothetical protein